MKELQTRHDLTNLELYPRAGLSSRGLIKLRVGINCELDTLKTAVIWGEPSVEAYLASACLPENVSLYFGNMDVFKAQGEMASFATLLTNNGVQIFKARDELAKLLPNQHLTKDQIRAKVLRKAAMMQEIHGIQRKGADEAITHLIDLDCERFGEGKGLALVQRLCLDEPLPLGNLVFARDQMNVLLDTRFSSSMAMPIRKPEVALYEMVYQQALGLPKPISMPKGETFEGGDAFVHDGVVYIGVGFRTSLGAALHIYQNLKPQLEDLGYKFVIVEDQDTKSRSFQENQNRMHLDTYSMPVAKGKFAICEEVASQTRALIVHSEGGGFSVENSGTFLQFLMNEKQEIIPIPLEEQENWAPNFVNLNALQVIATLGNNAVTNQRLIDAGKFLVVANLTEIIQGYGGAHCSIGQLGRSKVEFD